MRLATAVSLVLSATNAAAGAGSLGVARMPFVVAHDVNAHRAVVAVDPMSGVWSKPSNASAICAALYREKRPVQRVQFVDAARGLAGPVIAEYPCAEVPAGGVAEVIVNIRDIAEKPEELVSKLIGSGSCEKSKYGSRCAYRNGEIEITYIDGKSDWITVTLPPGTKFAPSALGALNLPETRPSELTQYSMRWSGFAGLRSVELAPGKGADAAFVYVKVKTP